MSICVGTARTALLVSGAILLTGCGSGTTSGDARSSANSPTVAWLSRAQQALVDKSFTRLAAGNGDAEARPQWEVVSTLGPAVHAMSDGDSITHGEKPSTPVVVAVGPGTFTWTAEKLPKGAERSTGRYLVVVLRESDGAVVMWGPSDTRKPMGTLGPVFTPVR